MKHLRTCVWSLICISLVFLSSCKDECEPASTADAGDDQELVNQTTATLDANTPEKGAGLWTIVSGSGGNIGTENDPKSTFTGTAGTTYVLSWTISGCPISTDEVQIKFVICNPATTANAGPDQDMTGTSATLAGNTPVNGTGTWSIVSGTGGNITNASSPTSEFTGTVNSTYVLKWTISGCPASSDEVQIKFNNNPKLVSIDKTTTINGEIITVTGLNFSSNFQGMSQIKAVNQADPTKEVFLPILSRTATEIKAVMIGTGGGTTGAYKLYYGKKPDANAATFYESSLTVTINAASANQFFSASAYTQSTNVSPGATIGIGTKNGSANAVDYTVKVIGYNYETGVGTEYTVNNVSVTVGGFGGTMDQVGFQLLNNLPAGTYYTKVTFNGATVIGGWGNSLNVF